MKLVKKIQIGLCGLMIAGGAVAVTGLVGQTITLENMLKKYGTNEKTIEYSVEKKNMEKYDILFCAGLGGTILSGTAGAILEGKLKSKEKNYRSIN